MPPPPELQCDHFHQRRTDFLSRLPASDVVVWTEGLSPLLWVPEAQVFTRPAEDAYSSLSNLTGPTSSSFSAESLALVHGLEWYHSHFKNMLHSIGSCLSFHGPGVSLTKFYLGYLGPLR